MAVVSPFGTSDPVLTTGLIGTILERLRPRVVRSKSLSVELLIEVSNTPVVSSIRGTSFASLEDTSRASVQARMKDIDDRIANLPAC